MKITKTEAIEKCAAVMGWHKSDIIPFWLDANDNTMYQTTSQYVGYYNPLEPRKLHQAFELLEKWIASDLHVRDYEASGNGEGGHLIMLVHERLTKGLKHWDIAGESSHKSLNAAIVLAVLQAVHGETYELAEG